jgi:hypothetical protein
MVAEIEFKKMIKWAVKKPSMCHSEELLATKNLIFFAEFTLSEIRRLFTSLRVTVSEGLRMT